MNPGARPARTDAAELAAFLAQASALPVLAIEHAKMAVASTLASAAAGAELRSVEIVRRLATERGGSDEATVWFSAGERLPAAEAARANAVASDAAACDDSDFRTIAHTGTTVCATALAMAERLGASGEEALAAIVVGYEASGRFAEAIAPPLPSRGIHPVALNGVGAAVTAARLLGLGGDATLHAIALACTAASGLLAGSNDWAREYQAGTAVHAGIDAALAAAAGYGVGSGLADGPGGLIDVLSTDADPGALRRGLGDEWDIVTDLGIKLRPGGYPFAAAVEAAIEASRALGVEPGEIASIVVSGPHLRRLVGQRRPRDFVEAIHSLAYYVAAGACDRAFSWDDLDPDKLTDPRIARLLELVDVDPDPEPAPDYAFAWGATVTIATADAVTATRTVDAPVGSARRGIEWADVDAKLSALLHRAGHAHGVAGAIAAAVHRLDRLDDVGELTALLRGAA